MLDNIFSSNLLNVVIIEPNRQQGRQLSNLISSHRPNLQVMVLDNSEQVFSLMYGEMNIDMLFFDIESEADTDNLALFKAIAPESSVIHWSDYRHPEVIELLYSLGVNSFCTKESDAETVLEAIDLAVSYPQSLYLDQKLHKCLPLLQN
jgi:DNA-binding NarL/FixJ family response regulator